MSKIKLPHASGNSVSIAAPQSNPASDRTLYLPSNADGTIVTNNSPATGSIVQVVEGDSTSYTQFTDNNFAASNLSATITPQYASSKILINTIQVVDTSASGRQMLLTIFRSIASGTYTNIISGSSNAAVGAYHGGDRLIETASIVKLDAPSYTVGNSITYKVYGKSSGSYSTEVGGQGSQSIMVLQEVAG
jgi:hypothetical protein